MRAGDLRHRLTIERPQRLSDGSGGAIINWLEVATVWASIKPVSTSRNNSGQQISSLTTHRITLRYRSDIDATMRLVTNGRTFLIDGILNEAERDQWLVCRCVEGVVA